jgi:hypothetical protein
MCGLAELEFEGELDRARTADLVGGVETAIGAAARLGLARTTLIAKMKKLGISRTVDQTDTTDLGENVEAEEVAVAE